MACGRAILLCGVLVTLVTLCTVTVGEETESQSHEEEQWDLWLPHLGLTRDDIAHALRKGHEEEEEDEDEDEEDEEEKGKTALVQTEEAEEGIRDWLDNKLRKKWREGAHRRHGSEPVSSESVKAELSDAVSTWDFSFDPATVLSVSLSLMEASGATEDGEGPEATALRPLFCHWKFLKKINAFHRNEFLLVDNYPFAAAVFAPSETHFSDLAGVHGTITDWLSNMRFLTRKFVGADGKTRGRVHRGYYAGYLNGRKAVLDHAAGACTKRLPGGQIVPRECYVGVLGWSRGGAMAFLGAADIKTLYPHAYVMSFTIGAPMVADVDFATFYKSLGIYTFRFVTVTAEDGRDDFVSILPPKWIPFAGNYAHCSKAIRVPLQPGEMAGQGVLGEIGSLHALTTYLGALAKSVPGIQLVSKIPEDVVSSWIRCDESTRTMKLFTKKGGDTGELDEAVAHATESEDKTSEAATPSKGENVHAEVTKPAQ